MSYDALNPNPGYRSETPLERISADADSVSKSILNAVESVVNDFERGLPSSGCRDAFIFRLLIVG